jgi:hypothetical protein
MLLCQLIYTSRQQEELFKVNEQLKISEVAYNQTLATTGVEFEIATAKGKIFLNNVLSWNT